MRIAIAGNPNSGKTTVYNLITGKSERVGNWSGVTVVNKESRLRRRFNHSFHDVMIVDLPGTYSLEAYSNDEVNATDYLKSAQLDAIINIVDASNLERSLKLTLELIETGIPVVVALNKSDVTIKKGIKINTEKLSGLIETPCMDTTATNNLGILKVVDKAIELAGGNEHGREKGYKKHRRGRRRNFGRCS